MVRLSLNVSIGVRVFYIDLVGKDAIRMSGDENIQKGKRVFILYFHSKLDVWGSVVKMVKKEFNEGRS
jgi:hypothetical protein